VKTFQLEMVGRVLVYAGTLLAPDDGEWRAYCEACRDFASKEPAACSLISSLGAGPSTMQRKLAIEVTPRSTRVAILMDSVMGRGIVKALMWFHPTIKVFGFYQTEPAARFLRLSATEQAAAFDALAKFRAEARHTPRT
jgi:hypothetical protein